MHPFFRRRRFGHGAGRILWPLLTAGLLLDAGFARARNPVLPPIPGDLPRQEAVRQGGQWVAAAARTIAAQHNLPVVEVRAGTQRRPVTRLVIPYAQGPVMDTILQTFNERNGCVMVAPVGPYRRLSFDGVYTYRGSQPHAGSDTRGWYVPVEPPDVVHAPGASPDVTRTLIPIYLGPQRIAQAKHWMENPPAYQRNSGHCYLYTMGVGVEALSAEDRTRMAREAGQRELRPTGLTEQYTPHERTGSLDTTPTAYPFAWFVGTSRSEAGTTIESKLKWSANEAVSVVFYGMNPLNLELFRQIAREDPTRLLGPEPQPGKERSARYESWE
ncbi:MAG: hypothetical protein IT371_16820 [Deltaproteobacteria bacterium]|nr:hypothetical protein [Deltaproteobacteria bacterium]